MLNYLAIVWHLSVRLWKSNSQIFFKHLKYYRIICLIYTSYQITLIETNPNGHITFIHYNFQRNTAAFIFIRSLWHCSAGVSFQRSKSKMILNIKYMIEIFFSIELLPIWMNWFRRQMVGLIIFYYRYLDY